MHETNYGPAHTAFADQLDDSLQLMAGSLRAGHSLLRAVDSVASEADAPTSGRALVDEMLAEVLAEACVGRRSVEELQRAPFVPLLPFSLFL